MLKGKTRLVGLIVLIVIWALLGHHYWSVLRYWVYHNLFNKDPIVYCMIEFMWLICLVVITWLGEKILDTLEKH